MSIASIDAAGCVAMSASAAPSGSLTDMATSRGFPCTTGAITISQPNALGLPEKFHITGMDERVNGVGTISLVSGALSDRAFSGPNANRGWLRLTLPEPGAAVGVAAALGMLAVCHRIANRRAKRGG